MSTTASTPVPENPQPSPAAAPVTDKRKAATGVIPKQMQSWIFLAIIGVVAVGLWFSSSAQKPRTSSGNGPAAGEQVRPTVTGFTTDQLQHRLEQTELAHQTALSNPTLNQTGRPPDSATGQDAIAPGTNSTAQPVAPVTDPIAEDERKREYVSRFASNVALSYRADSQGGNSVAHPPSRVLGSASNPDDLAAAAQAPALPPGFEQQLEVLQAQQEKLLAQQQQLATATALPAGASTQAPQPAPAPAASSHKNVDVNAAAGKEHVIF